MPRVVTDGVWVLVADVRRCMPIVLSVLIAAAIAVIASLWPIAAFAVIGAAALLAVGYVAYRRPIAGILAVMWYASVYSFIMTLVGDSVYMAISKELLMVVVMCACRLSLHRRGSSPCLRAQKMGARRTMIFSVGYGFLIAWCAMSFMWTDDIGRAVMASRGYVLYPAFALTVALTVRTEKQGHQLLQGISTIGGTLLIYGLLSYRFGPSVDPRYTTASAQMQMAMARTGISDWSVVSTYGNRPTAGAMAAMTVIILAGMAGSGSRRARRLLLTGSSTLALLLTFSRTAYFGLGAGLLARLLSNGATVSMRRGVAFVIALVSVLILVFLTPAMHEPILRALRSINLATLSGRTTLWAERASAISFAGIGMGVLGESFRFGTVSGLGVVDNTYMKVLLEIGLPGFLMFMFIEAFIVVVIARNSRILGSPSLRRANGVLCGCQAAILTMFFSADWLHSMPVMLVHWALAGVALVLPSLRES